MRPALSEVQALINRLKDERTSELDGEPKGPVSAALDAAQLVPVDALPAKNSPIKYPKDIANSAKDPMARINFQISQERFDRVSALLQIAKGPELGRALFEYYWELEVQD